MSKPDDERDAEGRHDEITRRGLEALVAKIHAPGWGALRAGVVVQRTWRLVQPLGSGRFGVVFAAHNEKLDRGDALKFLAPQHAGDEELRRRFTNETRVLASLQGEHLVRVYDCGEHEGLPFFVMERLLGQSLEARLGRDEPLAWEAFCAIALGILRALVEAHAHGIVHRDVKPANVMILDGERVKLLDFGLAMTIEQAESGSTFAGTPRYMAPELFERRARASEVTDVYSVGVILDQMLTGSVPAAPDEASARPALGRAQPEARAAVEALVRRANDRDPASRPASARELLEAFERALAGRGAPPVEGTESRSRARWTAAVVGTLCAGGAVLVGGGLAWPWAAAPWFSESGGILVTAPQWSSDEVDARYEALCTTLRESEPRRTSCARVSRWNAGPDRYREWLSESGASLAIHVSEDDLVRVELSNELLRDSPLLALLPPLERRDLEHRESMELLALLPHVASGEALDVPRIDPRTASHAWATFGALLRVARARGTGDDSYEDVHALAQCEGLRDGVEEAERYCAIARYLEASRRWAGQESCRRLEDGFEWLESIGDATVESGALAMHATCLVEEDPASAALLALRMLDEQPGGADPCATITLLPIGPYLTGQTEAEQRLARSLAAVDLGACANAAGTANSIALRGVSHRERGDWEAAAADFYAAYRYDTDDSRMYLVAWAEAQLRLPLDTAAKARLLAELGPGPGTVGSSLGDRQLAITIAFLRWIVSNDPNDANALLSLYEGVPEGSPPLPDGACDGQRERACPAGATPCSLDVLQRPATAERRVELRRALGFEDG